MSDISRAYTEVYEILRNISKEDLNKIPYEIIQTIKDKRDKEYNFQLIENIEFEEQNLLRETKILLAILYRDYWATIEEKERIKKKWKLDINKDEEAKKVKYNVDVFKNKNQLKNNVINNDNNLPIEIKRKSVFNKLILFIKKILKINK